MALFSWSGTQRPVEPPKHSTIRVCAPTQSGSCWVGRLSVGEAARPEHRDEELDGTYLARVPIDHHRASARVVDEGLLAGTAWRIDGRSRRHRR